MTLKLEDFEPVAHMYQHDETGRTTFIAMPYRMSERRWSEFPIYTASQMQQVIDQCNAKDAEIDTNVLISLDSEIKELRLQLAAAQAEIAELKQPGKNARMLVPLLQDLAEAQADSERLREAAESVCKSLEHPTESVNAIQMWNLRDALATTSPSDALREHDAKLVEMIAEYVDRNLYDCNEYADKIRKGEFK